MQPNFLSPSTIKSVSLDANGLRIIDLELAIAAKISALFVADFEPGILNSALIGTLAGLSPLRKGALQLVIWASLPATFFAGLGFIAAYMGIIWE